MEPKVDAKWIEDMNPMVGDCSAVLDVKDSNPSKDESNTIALRRHRRARLCAFFGNVAKVIIIAMVLITWLPYTLRTPIKKVFIFPRVV
jgi:hypothetical protein